MTAFFELQEQPTAAQIAEWTGGEIATGGDETKRITSIAPLHAARDGDLSFLDNTKYLQAFLETKASVVLIAKKFADRVPENVTAIVVQTPYAAYAEVVGRLIPAALKARAEFAGAQSTAHVHPDARLEEGVRIEPGAVVGPDAQIGMGTLIGANAVIGRSVSIGRECVVGSGATITHALIGDRVIIHPGVRMGQDGFGFALGPSGHKKVPQIGRVILQDDVEVGANSTIDRGANHDTVVGEGTKIDNLVQIGHNVKIGRHCIIVAQTGISGSAELGDFVLCGGKSGINGHVKIGDAAQIAGTSNVADDVPPGERWAGTPAKPLRDYMREVMALRKLAISDKNKKESGQHPPEKGN